MVLTPQQVLSVAAPFLSGGCDPVAALGLTRKPFHHLHLPTRSPVNDHVATPALTLTNTDNVAPGTLLTFGGAGLEGQDTSVRPRSLYS
jgi:hypothetical protein